MPASNYVHVDVKVVVAETDAALLLRFDHDGDEYAEWFPKSQMADPGSYAEGDQDVTVSVTEWIWNQKMG